MLVLIGSCTADPVSTTTTIDEAPPSTTASVPDALGAHLDWFLGVLNGAEVSANVYEERFAASFREAVPYEGAFVPIVQDLQSAGPYELIEVAPRSDAGLDAIVASADSTRFVVVLDIDSDEQIVGLLVQPAELPALENPPATLEEAGSRLSEHGEASLLAAEVNAGQCVPIHSLEAERPVPLGSAFKLYVLGALAEAVALGEVAWADEIVITDELKSVPSGVLQDRESGSTVTVLEAAELMISISDNTATDLLIDVLGRERVEEAQADLGHSQPELNIPFLTTREWAALKIGPDAEEMRADYLAADVAGKRAMLDDLASVRADSLPATAFLEPIEPDRLEWFGSLLDLCLVHVRLQELATEPGLEQIGDILSLNPGIPSEAWDYIAFKGGSEPGLLTTSWLVQGGDGTFFLAATVLNVNEPLDETEVVLLMGAARDLLAE
jgi:hypothetical protein